MPVYNCENYVGDAVKSILNQTFTDFEFLIFDDGSSDKSLEIIRSFTDPRIRLFTSKENQGYVVHLNRGLDLAKGDYLFRMDADDIALPRRFERQIKFMDAHPKIGLCGTWYRVFGTLEELRRPPLSHEEIQLHFLHSSTMNHPSVVLRRQVLEQHQLRYREDFLFAEDYEFFVRVSKYTRLANIPEVLLHYRKHATNVGALRRKRQVELSNRIRIPRFELLMGRPLKAIEARFIRQEIDFREPVVEPLLNFLQEAEAANLEKGLYNTVHLRRFLHRRIGMELILRRSLTPAYFKNLIAFGIHFAGVRQILAKQVCRKVQLAGRRLGEEGLLFA